VVSVLAVLCLDFFFVQPLLTFTIADPVDAAALGAFLTTSLVVSRLASKARQEAKSAERERANLARLYELAQTLLTVDPLHDDPTRILEALRAVFHLRAAALFDATTAEVHTCGDSQYKLDVQTRDTYIMGEDLNSEEEQVVVRCLRSAGRATGTLGLEGLAGQKALSGPVASLTGAALERMRAVRSASEAATEARTQTLRAAILDALAHEFKTPLATILTAAGGLHATGPLTSDQRELTGLMETEAARLSSLSSRLLRLARLDSQEVRPRRAPFDIQAALASLIESYRQRFPDRRLLFVIAEKPVSVSADRELFHLAVSQLLDNACRYSPGWSRIQVTLRFDARHACVVVWNGGPGIPKSEAARIFERFYRGADGCRLASGTGLGLYVARKIAVAHGGRLDLDFTAGQGGVAFRLAIPTSGEELDFDEPTSARVDCG
jgi:two-component system sensor histidine kinase KdpD